MTGDGASVERCKHGHHGHVEAISVDALDWVFWSCRTQDGMFCGDADIEGQFTPARAAVIRRAEREYERVRGWWT